MAVHTIPGGVGSGDCEGLRGSHVHCREVALTHKGTACVVPISSLNKTKIRKTRSISLIVEERGTWVGSQGREATR